VFETVQDTTQKLHNTVILYGCKPVFVITGCVNPEFISLVTENNTSEYLGFTYIELPIKNLSKEAANSSKFAYLYDPLVDFRSLSSIVGYFNWFSSGKRESTKACFISRMPVRNSIQGMCSKNTYISAGNLTKDLVIADEREDRLNWSSLISEQSFCDMVSNKYPNIKAVGEHFRTNKYTVSVAFHKLFAVNTKGVGPFFLEYKGRDIGWSDTPDNFKLDSKFDFLREVVEHYNIPCRG
jgi:hypothetical protein